MDKFINESYVYWQPQLKFQNKWIIRKLFPYFQRKNCPWIRRSIYGIWINHWFHTYPFGHNIHCFVKLCNKIKWCDMFVYLWHFTILIDWLYCTCNHVQIEIITGLKSVWFPHYGVNSNKPFSTITPSVIISYLTVYMQKREIWYISIVGYDLVAFFQVFYAYKALVISINFELCRFIFEMVCFEDDFCVFAQFHFFIIYFCDFESISIPWSNI